MRYSVSSFFQTLLALTRRDMRVFSNELLGTLIDGVVIIITEALLFGSLMPIMGMPVQSIGPMFIGTVIWVFFFLGENLAIHHVFDLKHRRYIDYQLTLPIPHAYLFTHYVLSFLIKTTLIGLPLLYFGIWLLGPKFVIIQFNGIGFALVYLLSIIFIALFFLYLSFGYSFQWFMDNVWPRILSPLWGFGCVFFLWQQVYEITPLLAYLFLLNPLTYISEGMRTTIIGGDQFINVWYCIGMLLLFIALVMFGLAKGVEKQLDPV